MLSLLAVVCPPLAVFLTAGRRRAVANLGLTLLLYAPGLVHALTVVDRYHTDQRNATLMRLAAQYA
jgi:uncharacterized membrane protein YqaE (UPF0057 family)